MLLGLYFCIFTVDPVDCVLDKDVLWIMWVFEVTDEYVVFGVKVMSCHDVVVDTFDERPQLLKLVLVDVIHDFLH